MPEPAARYRHRTVFTVPPGAPFLHTVARGLLDGRLVEGFAWRDDPLALARATIYVPTRRAARELRSVLMDALGATAILLPRIRPLGEVDEDAAFLAAGDGAMLDVPPAIDTLERQLALGRLVARWTQALAGDLRGALYESEPVTTPVSVADAFWMAADLAALIDQLRTEGIGFARIEAAAGADVSRWWHVTLAFLQIVKTSWPAYLDERRRLDPADHRNRMIRAEAARLEAAPPAGPVVVAGSTGTIPATAELIATVAKLPLGAVVLPGYDTAMDADTRALLQASGDATPVIGHPQFGMYKLVRAIGVAPDAIDPLGAAPGAPLAARARWVAAGLAPAGQTARWARLRASLPETAFDGVGVLHAANEQAEALAIACALREAILDPKATAALVTPDRQLARRVASELGRFGIEAADSGGTPFALTGQGVLLAFTLSLAGGEADPAGLLALLKHPLARFGAGAADHRAAVADLEMLALRGGTGRIRLGAFACFVETALGRWNDDRRRKPAWYERLDGSAFERVHALAARVQAAFAPLSRLDDTADHGLDETVRATIAALEAIGRDDRSRHDALYAGEGGRTLEGLLARLLASDVRIAFPLAQWPQMVRALTGTLAVRPGHGGHPRIHVWGTLEARLQSVDLMVLGGLNEGTWPAQAANDAFLTRAMKAEIGLDPPERRIGLAAHDFQMAMGHRHVLVTRARRAGGSPTVASRWLQRLETLAGAAATGRLRRAGERYMALADIVAAPMAAPPALRPGPAPPRAARPDALSVTEVETLRRDPYAIYARLVLALAPLDPLVRDPDFADRGSLIHAVMEEAARAGIDWTAADAAARFEAMARARFDAEALPPDIDALWWARMLAAIPNLVAWEAGRAGFVRRTHPEARARRTPVGATGVMLRGYADRIDLRRDGRADIVDFKTGTAPSGPQVEALIAPQLPLEAALAARGAFDALGRVPPGDLLYVRLGARGEVDPRPVSGGKYPGADELAQRAWEKLEGLCAHYADEAHGYPSRVMPFREGDFAGDYDHLARALEWMNAAGGNGGGDDGTL